jgi:hypothetical protein
MMILMERQKLPISEPLPWLEGERETASEQLIELEIAYVDSGAPRVPTEAHRRGC